MALDLLKRVEKGSPLTIAEHDANLTAIENEVDGKAASSHTHTESDITDLSHDAASLLGTALDATVGSPSDGDILVFRSAGGDWVLEAKPSTLNASLTDIDDVAITTPADNEVLAFDNASGDWINQTPAEAGLATAAHTHAIDALSDVTIATPANNEVLAWDTGTGNWINQTPIEAGLQALLSTVGVTVRGATGLLNFSGGVDGDVWTVQADGSVAFEAISSHTHTLSQITDAGALAALDTVGTAQIDNQAVTAAKIEDQAGVTPGPYTNATVTVSQEGIITAISSGSGGDGLSTSFDSATALTVGAAPGTHKVLDAATAITLTLSATAAVNTRQAFTPGGAGAVTVQVTGSAGYWLPRDNTTGSVRTASFGLTGYGYFEVIRNTGGSAAEWAFFGNSDHADLADNALDMADEVLSRPELKDYAETRTTPSSSSGTLTLDMEQGNCFEVTLTENVTTLTLSNPPATGKIGTIFLILKQDGTGGHTFAWPASIQWAGGTAPTISSAASAIDIFTLVTPDAGTTWYGFTGGQAFA